MRMCLCEGKVKAKMAHFRLLSAFQKRACLSSLVLMYQGAFVQPGYRQHDSRYLKVLSDHFQWSRVKCRKFDRLEREMNPASNFACYRTMFKVATESNGGRVSNICVLDLPLQFKGIQDTY